MKTIKRTACFDWCPISGQSFIATGTASGALDATFSSTTELEVFEIDWKLSDKQLLDSKVKLNMDGRFNKLSWSSSTEKFKLGVIAGAMEEGVINLIDAHALINNKEESLITSKKEHNGNVKAFQFHPSQINLFASGASQGEIFIWNLQDVEKPYTPGPRSSKLEEITDISWNNQVQHILASSSINGYTSVWDLKNKREVMSLVYKLGNKNCSISSVTWHPYNATKLVTCSNEDENPVVMVWDLRNSNSPQSILKGHEKGVLSVDWCSKDENLLLSSGKDGKIICFNPNTQEIIKEFESQNNWVFETKWNILNPNLVTSASFDGNINIYNLLNAPPPKSQNQKDQEMEDVFAPKPQTTETPLKYPPKWLKRPVLAKFGFNSKFVSFSNSTTENNSYKLNIYKFDTKSKLANLAISLENSLNTSSSKEFCSSKTDNNKKLNDWAILKLLFEENSRKELIKILGVSTSIEINDDKQKKVLKDKEESVKSSQLETETEQEKKENEDVSSDNKINNEEQEQITKSGTRLSTFFAKSNDNDFFQDPSKYSTNETQETENTLNETETNIEKSIKFDENPFSLNANDDTIEGKLAMLVIVGNFEQSVEICLKEERYSDALILAACGGPKLVTKTQKHIFNLSKNQKSKSFLRLIENVIDGNLTDTVANANVNEWDKILAMICTYAQGDEFVKLCEILADRILQSNDQSNNNALVCYLASGNIEKAIKIWIRQASFELKQNKDKENHNKSEQIYRERLQEIIEKITMFTHALHGPDQNEENPSIIKEDANLLQDVYYEYALLLALQGQPTIALRYINKMPTQNHDNFNNENIKECVLLLRDRLYKAINNKGASQYPTQKYLIIKQKQMANNNYLNNNQQNMYNRNLNQQQQSLSYNNNNNYYQQQPQMHQPNFNQQQQQQFNYNQPSSTYPYNQQAPPTVAAPPITKPNSNTPLAQKSHMIAKSTTGWNDPPETVFPTRNIQNKSNEHKQQAIHSPFPNQFPNEQPYFNQAGVSNSSYPPNQQQRPVMPPPKDSKVAPPMFANKNINPSQPQKLNKPSAYQNHQLNNQMPQQLQRPPVNSSGQMMQNQINPQRPIPRQTSGGFPQPQAQRPQPPMPSMQRPSPIPRAPTNHQNAQRMPPSQQFRQPMPGRPQASLSPQGMGFQRPLPNNHMQNPMQQRPPILSPQAQQQRPLHSPGPAPPSISSPNNNPSPILVEKAQIPKQHLPIYDTLNNQIIKIKSSAQNNSQNQRLIVDTQKKIDILFDLIIKNKIDNQLFTPLNQICKAFSENDNKKAQTIYQNMVQLHFNSIGTWGTAIKNIIQLQNKMINQHQGNFQNQ